MVLAGASGMHKYTCTAYEGVRSARLFVISVMLSQISCRGFSRAIQISEWIALHAQVDVHSLAVQVHLQ